MAKPVDVKVRIADLPQFKQFISSVATLLGVLAADQLKRDMATFGGGDIGPPLQPSDEDRIREAMAEAAGHPGRVVTR